MFLFSDVFSYLMLSTESVSDLQVRLNKKNLAMTIDERRFRPNLLIHGKKSFLNDTILY